MLTGAQYAGAVVLVSGLVLVSYIVHTIRQPMLVAREEYRDSLRVADSLAWQARKAFRQDSLQTVWAAQRAHRKDSLEAVWAADRKRRKDSLEVVWAAQKQRRKDSLQAVWHKQDSLRADSLHTYRHEKRDTLIHLHSADTSSLQYIRGIGPYTARRIVRLRDALGGFYSTEQLADFLTDSVRAHLVAEPDSIRPIRVNTTSLQGMVRHPYLSYEQAKAICDLRARKMRIRSIEQIADLPCFDEKDVARLRFYLSFE